MKFRRNLEEIRIDIKKKLDKIQMYPKNLEVFK